MNERYGRSPDNPIQLNSIVASRLFLDNLVSSSGYHILYHRRGSFAWSGDGTIIDHYEIMCTDNHYDDFYINIYNETNEWIPPDGFLFEEDLETSTFFLSNYEISELNETQIKIDEKYLLTLALADDPDEVFTQVGEFPILELYMEESSGVNGFNDEFPYSMIKKIVTNHRLFSNERLEEVISSIKPRG